MPDLIDLNDLKSILQITGTVNDARLHECVYDANIETDKALGPSADKLEKGTDLYEDAKRMALTYAKYRWMLDIRQYEFSRDLLKQYEDKRDSLIATLRADRTSRTKSILIADDPRRRKLLLPAQKDLYVLDDF